ncbi:MAG: hypothetical protein O7A03_11845 [Alphaproteobacteria bacterium]|nr:hypothetical protein [Alphaproteobacteria bacterium]
MSTSQADKLGTYMSARYAALLGVDRDDFPSHRQAQKSNKDQKQNGKDVGDDRHIDRD